MAQQRRGGFKRRKRTSAKNQRKVTTAIKRARVMALMPFVNED